MYVYLSFYRDPAERVYLFISRRIFGIHGLSEDDRELVLVDLFERMTYITSSQDSPP